MNMEAEYIRIYNSNNPAHGYNRNSGGFGNIGRVYTAEDRKRLSDAHKNPSEEIRKKYSAASKRRKVSAETRAKMSKSQIGHETSNETRDKISKALTGKTRSEETRKKVSDGLKLYYANGGFPANKGKPMSEETKKKLHDAMFGRKIPNEQLEKRKPHGVPVRCVETGEVFETISLASKKTGADATAISSVLKGKKYRKTAGGYHWAAVPCGEADE